MVAYGSLRCTFVEMEIIHCAVEDLNRHACHFDILCAGVRKNAKYAVTGCYGLTERMGFTRVKKNCNIYL